MLARPWLYVRVDLDPDEISVLVVGNGGSATMECLFAQLNVEIAVDYSNDS